MHAADNVLAAGPTLVGVGIGRHPEYQPLAELGHVIDGSGVLYYVRLSGRLALGLVLVWVAMAAGPRVVASTATLPLWAICLLIFALVWVGQFWGHKVEGTKPSLL